MLVYSTGILFCCLVAICAGAGKWNYIDPFKWKDTGFPICGRNSQTPVNIDGASCDEALYDSITYINYNISGTDNFTLKNTGYTVQLDFPASLDAKVQLGNGFTYKLAQLHFHWGQNDGRGSEHELKGEMFPAELHFVHFNMKYGSLGNAADKSDGLAVLGVFIEHGKDGNAAFNFLDFTTNNVTYAGTNVEVDAFPVQTLLPSNKDVFYRYSGSLTTPPCFESVTWTVFNDLIYFSEEQLQGLRKLQSNEGKDMVDNYRPVLPLNGRTITYWDEEACSGAQDLRASFLIGLIGALLLFA